MIPLPDSKPRVLFLHPNKPCYLAEPLFHGLRTILGSSCVDVPRYDSLYSPIDPDLRKRLRGHGFSLYGLLTEISQVVAERYLWKHHLDSWDLIVIADIWEQGDLFLELSQLVPPEKLVVLDGGDTSAFYPFAYRLRTRPWSYLAALRKNAYFKRELTNGGEARGLSRFLPQKLLKAIPIPANAHQISFSIPAEKITEVPLANKSKDFPRHIVDEELARLLKESFHSPSGSDQYAFTAEEQYYSDLRASRFGITTKRAGWDCLRHYELAANGCIICFRDLDQKPLSCAPHGLSAENCIIYSSATELLHRIAEMGQQDLQRLSDGAIRWAKNNTTTARAMEFLGNCGLKIGSPS